MFSWLFKTGIKKEINNIHNILHNSFGNIKKDITNLHIIHLEKEKKLKEYEERLIRIETYLFSKLESSKQRGNILSFDTPAGIEDIYGHLTFTNLKIFRTLHDLQKRIDNKPISIKSLAKIIYPDKKYEKVRSTISEYLAQLSTAGLVSKQRQGKETFAEITDIGFELVEKLKQEGKTKEKLKLKNKYKKST